MVSRWGSHPPVSYLAIKLEIFTKCPAGQIVTYKLNNNKKTCVSADVCIITFLYFAFN